MTNYTELLNGAGDKTPGNAIKPKETPEDRLARLPEDERELAFMAKGFIEASQRADSRKFTKDGNTEWRPEDRAALFEAKFEMEAAVAERLGITIDRETYYASKSEGDDVDSQLRQMGGDLQWSHWSALRSKAIEHAEFVWPKGEMLARSD